LAHHDRARHRGRAGGGFLGNLFFGAGLRSFFSLRTWILSFVGSLLTLAVWGAIKGRTRGRP